MKSTLILFASLQVVKPFQLPSSSGGVRRRTEWTSKKPHNDVSSSENLLGRTTFSASHALQTTSSSSLQSSSNNNSGGNSDAFWESQKQLAEQLSQASEESLSREQTKKFAAARLGLVGDTLYIGTMVFAVLWYVAPNPFVALSYSLGAVLGTAYVFGLGKYVEGLGKTDIAAATEPGAGVGQARFAFFILLFVFIGKFRASGVLEIPAILGFFTYQLASFAQIFRE